MMGKFVFWTVNKFDDIFVFEKDHQPVAILFVPSDSVTGRPPNSFFIGTQLSILLEHWLFPSNHGASISAKKPLRSID